MVWQNGTLVISKRNKVNGHTGWYRHTGSTLLFTYRTTPTSNGKSPAELLMNRQPRSRYDGLKRSNHSEVKSLEDNAHLTPEFNLVMLFLY